MCHKIEIKDLQKFVNEESIIIADCHGINSNKELKVRLRGGYEVWNNDELLLETMQQNNAVTKYNSLP